MAHGPRGCTIVQECWPAQGRNVLTVALLGRDAGVASEPGVRDVELETKYLMGAAFHRGQVRPPVGRAESTGKDTINAI